MRWPCSLNRNRAANRQRLPHAYQTPLSVCHKVHHCYQTCMHRGCIVTCAACTYRLCKNLPRRTCNTTASAACNHTRAVDRYRHTRNLLVTFCRHGRVPLHNYNGNAGLDSYGSTLSQLSFGHMHEHMLTRPHARQPPGIR